MITRKSGAFTFVLAILMSGPFGGNLGAIDVPFSSKHTVAEFFPRAHAVHAADVDGDGDVDILGAAHDGKLITWWENIAGDAKAWTEHIVDDSFVVAVDVYAADVDGDGDLDILGAAFGDEVAWWENMTGDARVLIKHTLSTDFDGPAAIHAADVDGDGDLDILVAGKQADEIAWWENTEGNATAWTQHTVAEHFNGASDVYAADLDGDGDLDILGSADLADEIAWWENTAGDATAWTQHPVDDRLIFAESVYAADVDGDGDLDILAAVEGLDEIAWWENTAGDATAWTKHIVDGFFDVASSVNAADVDADGDLDILGSATVAHDIAWWENMAGNGTAWTKHTVDGNFNGAHDVEAADLDGDGDLDLLGAAFGANDIAWWENETPHPVQPPAVNSLGIVNGASFELGENPLAPGAIATIFGTSLNDGSGSPSSSFGDDGKLLSGLAGASVTFNGFAAPLFSSYPNQLNVQVPYELAGIGSASVLVTVGNQTSAEQIVLLGSFSPGIFTLDSQGTGQGVIQIANTAIFAAPAGSVPDAEARPAAPGEIITIYCTGLGQVTNPPATGEPASSEPLSATVTAPLVTIGGVPANVSFAGLAPGFVGVYQVNAQIPLGSPLGNSVPVTVTIGGAQSNTVTVAVGSS